MNVVAWARVSSREQKEGYSIDAQLRAMRDRAQREDWKIVREFVVAESARRGAERIVFNEMFNWVRKNAKREKIDVIFAHKLDRVCRNMRDAVRLQELEDDCGVKLSFVDNQFGPGAAGMLSFNVMAAVAQYYSDNLRTEVIKGIDEKVRQGWAPGLAPFGYINDDERDEPIKPHPEHSKAVIRIFELYARGDQTFGSLANQLADEGYTYRPSYPRFLRSSLSHILNNRIYIGEITHHGCVYPGKHRPLVDRQTFQTCQDILNGKNRRTGSPDLPLAGGLFQCAYCGQSITGERIRRKLRNGDVREHVYYRCANNHPGADHPTVRWRSEDLERAIIDDLATLQLPTREIHDWFRQSLAAAFEDIEGQQRRQTAMLSKRQAELKNMQDRLLNGYLGGAIDEKTFQTKTTELKTQATEVQENLAKAGRFDRSRGERALRVFDWSQNAADRWRGSNNPARREILESVCLNRTLTNVSLCAQKRRPFDILAKRPSFEKSRGERI